MNLGMRFMLQVLTIDRVVRAVILKSQHDKAHTGKLPSFIALSASSGISQGLSLSVLYAANAPLPMKEVLQHGIRAGEHC